MNFACERVRFWFERLIAEPARALAARGSGEEPATGRAG